MRNCYYMIGIERNKDPELPHKQRNTSQFVILDDRKHGRAGKFPVFYDVADSSYLEPPQGFLDSAYETLGEWYAANPEDDPAKEGYKPKHGSMNLQPLSKENEENSHETDLVEQDIPPEDEDQGSDPSVNNSWGSNPVSENPVTTPLVEEDFDDTPPF